MKIAFRNKEESNRTQEEEFLKLSGAERFVAFMKLCKQVNQFPISEVVIKP